MMKQLVEIDTSQPFRSVKEAVTRFGSNRPSIPHHSLSKDVDHKELETLYDDRMDEHTSELESVLITRERETLEVLKELEDTKKLLHGLKVSLPQEEGTFIATPKIKSPKSKDLGSARPLMDVDLAVIRASVGSLNMKMSEDIEVPNHMDMFYTQRDRISPNQKEVIRSLPDSSSTRADQDSQFSFEADQFKKMVETSRYEVMKAMSEIEKTKVSIKMAEMRLDAARKIEEAAKAVEAIAFAERNLNCENSLHKKLLPEDLISFEEYKSHSHKSKEAEDICKTKFIDRNGIRQMRRETRKLKQTHALSQETTFRNEGGGFLREDTEDDFRGGMSNFHNIQPSVCRKDTSLPRRGEFDPVEGKNDHVYRSTTSIGDILSRRLVFHDDFGKGKLAEAEEVERKEASLSQMIREQSGQIFRHVKSVKDGRRVKHFFAEKKFGCIHVVLPKKRNKRNKPCT